MSIPVKKVGVLGIVVLLLGVATVFGLKTLTLKEVIGPVEAETIYGPIKLTLRLDRNTFRLGEEINVTVTITNISNETITLAYSQPPRTEYAVYDNSSQMIFLFGSSVGWPCVGVKITLAPSESYSNIWKWRQEKAMDELYDELHPVDPGTYYIAGRTGFLLYYLGPADDFREEEFHGFIEVIETPKIEIKIL